MPLIPEKSALGVHEALDAAEELGYPVAVKLDPSVVAHKATIGGLRLGLRDEMDVTTAVEQLGEITESSPTNVRVVVQHMAPQGLELVVGGLRNDRLGPAVLVGLGGVLVEILDEVAVGLVPLDEREAQQMLGRLCKGLLVNGDRSLSSKAQQDLVAAIEGVSRLLVADPTISEIDINPLIASKSGAVAVDGLVCVVGRDGNSRLAS